MVLFLVFSALVANPNNYFTPGQSRSWSTDQGKKEIKKVYQYPPPPALLVRRKQSENHATHLHAPRRNGSRSVSRLHKDSFDLSTGPIGVASEDSTLLCAMTTSPVYLPLSSSGDVSPPVYLFFPSRGHEPPPALRDSFNSHLSL